MLRYLYVNTYLAYTIFAFGRFSQQTENFNNILTFRGYYPSLCPYYIYLAELKYNERI